MLKIGEFAQKNNVSVKLLRHYDAEGVLKPQKTDEWTGYRLYGETQEKLLRWILLLKNVGLSLREIKSVLNGPADTAALLRLLKAKRIDNRRRHNEEITRGLQIDRIIAFVEREGFDVDRSIDLMLAPVSDVREMMKNMPGNMTVIEAAEALIAENPKEPIVLFRGDIWRMKAINDSYGHDAGDRAITAFYDSITSVLTSAGASVGRTHGDEFIGVFAAAADEAEMLMKTVITGYAEREIKGVPKSALGSRFGLVAGVVTKEELRSRLSETYDVMEDARKLGKDTVVIRRV
ncbi:MAG: MerR family transcriptional regulator [Oscillospiraceae bacterium]|jgi:diguanylate cyclase (GGDEF)-like protein|nr:MerR family transcriptional regulator [Oscillospiraceae bacterium]